MSVVGRFLIAGFCFAWAVVFTLFAPSLGDKANGMYVMAGCTGLVGLTCIRGPWQRPLLRVIAGSIFALSIVYVRDEVVWLWTGQPEPDKHHTSLMESLLAFAVFGAPGGYFALFGRLFQGRYMFHDVPITEEGIGVMPDGEEDEDDEKGTSS